MKAPTTLHIKQKNSNPTSRWLWHMIWMFDMCHTFHRMYVGKVCDKTHPRTERSQSTGKMFRCRDALQTNEDVNNSQFLHFDGRLIRSLCTALRTCYLSIIFSENQIHFCRTSWFWFPFYGQGMLPFIVNCWQDTRVKCNSSISILIRDNILYSIPHK